MSGSHLAPWQRSSTGHSVLADGRHVRRKLTDAGTERRSRAERLPGVPTTVQTSVFSFSNSLDRVRVPFAFAAELPCRRASGRQEHAEWGYPQQIAVW